MEFFCVPLNLSSGDHMFKAISITTIIVICSIREISSTTMFGFLVLIHWITRNFLNWRLFFLYCLKSIISFVKEFNRATCLSCDSNFYDAFIDIFNYTLDVSLKIYITKVGENKRERELVMVRIVLVTLNYCPYSFELKIEFPFFPCFSKTFLSL